MERLPFIDDHVARIDATPEQAWAALLTTLGTTFMRAPPRALSLALGLEQPTRTGDWTTSVAVGDTLPGFAVVQSEPARRLTLRGRHRFSRYELGFELDASNPRRVELRATSSAVFPGTFGRIYRALVIGTGGHRVLVRRLLVTIARRAERSRARGT